MTEHRRLKVLILAYAADPTKGSEHGAGWEWSRAAAIRNDVWLLTRAKHRSRIEEALKAEPSLQMTPLFFDLPPFWRKAKRRIGQHAYYLLWQHLVQGLIRETHRRIGFDLLHHLTFSADWLPSALSTLPSTPLIWGPVAGATKTPWPLLRWLGGRGLATEAARVAITGLGRRIWGDKLARRATLVLVNNHETRRRFERHGRVIVEPHSAVPRLSLPLPIRPPDTPLRRRAVFVGRLIPWKGCLLAVEALARPAADGWELDVYGSGPDLDRIARRVQALSLHDRVHFMGQRPREEILAAFSKSDALLFPSFHDGAPFVVAESLEAGCPVICFNHGGCAVLVANDGASRTIPPHGDVVSHLAQALSALSPRSSERGRWSTDRLPPLIDFWYRTGSAATPIA